MDPVTMSTEANTDLELEILDAVDRFVEREVRPNVAALEREKAYPTRLVKAMAEMGLFGIAVPEEFGGLGLSLPAFCKVLTSLARGWTTLAAYVNSHSTVAYAINSSGTHAQKEKYLPLLATGELRAALCLTESNAGSDLQAIRAQAKRSGNGYTLNGNKIFVTNGGKAGLVLVLTKTDPAASPRKRGMSLFLVETAGDGISSPSVYHKMAYGLVDTVELLFENVALPESALLGGVEGQGLGQMLNSLEIGRIAIGASAVGLAAAALAEARTYARTRSAFGVTIDNHQAVQLRLAEMATKLTTARLVVEEAARVKQRGERADILTGMAKLHASEACLEICGEALRIHGGYGYIDEYAIERLYREAPLYVVGEGTNDIQKLVIARRVLDGGDDHLLGLAG